MLTDTHAHLDFPDFASDFDAVLARAEAAGVHRIITIGTTVEGSHRAVALAERHRNVFATVGIHPGQAHETNPDFIPQLRTLARSPRVVAIGEIGRDHHRLPSILQPGPDADIATQDQAIKDAQASVFAQQLTLAAELGLNVVIHERDAWDDTLAQLAPYHGRLRAVFHCFGKSPQHARQLLAHNHLVSFTGIVTFKNAAVVQEQAGFRDIGRKVGHMFECGNRDDSIIFLRVIDIAGIGIERANAIVPRFIVIHIRGRLDHVVNYVLGLVSNVVECARADLQEMTAGRQLRSRRYLAMHPAFQEIRDAREEGQALAVAFHQGRVDSLFLG